MHLDILQLRNQVDKLRPLLIRIDHTSQAFFCFEQIFCSVPGQLLECVLVGIASHQVDNAGHIGFTPLDALQLEISNLVLVVSDRRVVELFRVLVVHSPDAFGLQFGVFFCQCNRLDVVGIATLVVG